MFIQRDSALQFISKSSGFFPSSSWWTLERNVYPESKLLLMLVRETIWSKISYPSKLFFPPQRTCTKCSSISPFFMTHISVNIHLMQFSTKYTHSFSLRNYANCLRHEAELDSCYFVLDRNRRISEIFVSALKGYWSKPKTRVSYF